MKKAYTLAEVLVTITIIGILSAVMLPLANKLKPDSNKALYLKTYDSLVQILNAVSSDTDLYPEFWTYQNNNYDFTQLPLYNTTSDLDLTEFPDIKGGNQKLCSILAIGFGQTSECTNVASKYSANTFSNKLAFTNRQGVQFGIYSHIILNNTTQSFDTQITIDINGNNKPNCKYSTTCTKPDRFTFLVSPDGHVIASDVMGQAYLATRTNLRSKSNYSLDDYEEITELPSFWKQKQVIITPQNSKPGTGSSSEGGDGTGSDGDGTGSDGDGDFVTDEDKKSQNVKFD